MCNWQLVIGPDTKANVSDALAALMPATPDDPNDSHAHLAAGIAGANAAIAAFNTLTPNATVTVSGKTGASGSGASIRIEIAEAP
jgi:hypothetical protein